MKIKKQRSLLPTLKEKKRYVVFEVLSDIKLNFADVKNEILKEFSLLVGSLGSARAGLIFMEDWKDNKGIIRVNNKFVDYVKACFCVTNKISGADAIVKSVSVSGILNKARMEVE